jgi:hypothetical protein
MVLLTATYPFGFSLWSYFDKLFVAVFGHPATDFQVTSGVTPMTTLGATISVIVTYYCAVLGGQQLMKGLPAMKLQTAFIIHNLILTVISALLLVLFVEQVLPTLWKKGLFIAICEAEGGWTRELVVLYYVRFPSLFLFFCFLLFFSLEIHCLREC